jgi:hypothetical protein
MHMPIGGIHQTGLHHNAINAPGRSVAVTECCSLLSINTGQEVEGEQLGNRICEQTHLQRESS